MQPSRPYSSHYDSNNAIENRVQSKAPAAPAPLPKDTVPPVIERLTFDSRGFETKKSYKKGHLLGKGGFAKCYLFIDNETKKQSAVKVVSKSSLVKERHKTKLKSEISIHRSLHHANIVKFEDVFEDTDNIYILMELCPNQTMMELVKRKKHLEEGEAKAFLVQLVSLMFRLEADILILP